MDDSVNLLDSIALPGVGDLAPRGLVVFVGPNSCGKTQALYDIQHRLTGQPRSLVVLESVKTRKPKDRDGFMESLVKAGHLDRRFDPNGEVRYSPTAPGLGLSQAIGQSNDAQIRGHFENFALHSGRKARTDGEASFLQYFGPLLSTSLFLRNRLTFSLVGGTFDVETAPPANELQAVYLKGDLRHAFTREMLDAFGRAAWLDTSRGTGIVVRIADDEILPDAEDRHEPAKMSRFRTLDLEGDGLRSYAAICLALLPSRRPVCLIDEPETCLHPPQALAIGRLIGRRVPEGDGVVFVATHSSHVLRGILESGQDVTIVRLTRRKDGFGAQLVPPEQVRELVRDSRARSESVLDGLFADGVLLVEAEDDRSSYQGAWRGAKGVRRQELAFVAVNGFGGMAGPARFYKSLGIPTCAIADLDFVLNTGSVRALAVALGADETVRTAAESASRRVVERLNAPAVAQIYDGLVQETRETLAKPWDWAGGDARKLGKALRELAKRLDRPSPLRAAGQLREVGQDQLAADIEAAVSACRAAKICLVPVGELEDWDTPTVPTPVPATLVEPKPLRADASTGSMGMGDFVCDAVRVAMG